MIDPRLRVEIEVDASCAPERESSIVVRCPTEAGMEGLSRETFDGTLSVRMWRRLPGGEKELVLAAQTQQAALEVGGSHLEADSTWRGSCAVGETARAILAADVPLPRSLLPGL